MTRDSHLIDVFLLGDVQTVLPLLQSAFLYLLNDHTIAFHLAPFVPSRIQYSSRLIKHFARLTGSHVKRENISFAVLKFFAGGVIEIGNLFP